MPFEGETMHCCMCGKEEQSHPVRRFGWILITIGSKSFNVCPAHLLHCKTKSQWEKAYRDILIHINRIGGGLL